MEKGVQGPPQVLLWGADISLGSSRGRKKLCEGTKCFMKGYCFCCRVWGLPYESVVEILGSWRGKVEEMINRHKTKQRFPTHFQFPCWCQVERMLQQNQLLNACFKVGCISLVCTVHGSRAGACSQGPNSVSLKMQLLCLSLSFFQLVSFRLGYNTTW